MARRHLAQPVECHPAAKAAADAQISLRKLDPQILDRLAKTSIYIKIEIVYF